MEKNSKPKVVLFAYHSTNLLDQYWEELKDKADCLWVTFSPLVYTEIKRLGYKNVCYKSSVGREFKSVLLNKIIRRLKDLFSPQAYPKLIKKTLDELDPDIIVSNVTFPLVGYRSRAMRTLVFHSAPYKKLIVIASTLDYDLVLLPGEHHKKVLCERFDVDNPEKLQPVGWPRVDDFLSGKYTEEDRVKFLETLGLDPKLKTVMYAPTWSSFKDRGLFPESFGEYTEAFEEFCKRLKENDINVIVRLHGIVRKLINDPKLHKIAKKYNVYFVRGLKSEFLDNASALFSWASDVLISDTSGMITDYLVLNRPIVFVDSDSENFTWENSDLPESFRTGVIADSLDKILDGVKRSLDNPEEYETKRKEVTQKIYCNLDGMLWFIRNPKKQGVVYNW